MTNSTSSDRDTRNDARRPYAEAARVYRELGWRGVLPVDLGGRPGHVPTGTTGHDGVDPGDEQVTRWTESHGDHNVGLRLPDDVLGLDVDVYGDKRGDQTVDYVAYQLDAGELPPTWTSTARGAGQPSRIHLYRVPAGVAWRSDLGRGSSVEVIRRGHRWVRCWPSANHRLVGRGVDATYRWYRPDGTSSDRPPRPEELTALPDGWVAVLRDDSTARLPDRERSADRNGDHRRDDAPVVDQDGQPVDPVLVLEHGLPIGSQQTELFRYMCSLRARNLRREEMLVLGMVALQRMENDPTREPWRPSDVESIVDHVRREYAPGNHGALSSQLQAIAERLTAGTSVDEPVPTEESATDLGNSLRFARLFRERARYAEDVQRWYVWDGRRWAPDPAGLRVMDLTKHVIEDVRRQALGDDAHRDDWLRWANQSEGLVRREAMIKGARSEPGAAISSERLDADPDLLVVRNGTVDLRTGELRESRPDDLCSHLAEVEHDPDATYERWRAHVELLCADDPELVAYLARAVGYSLTGGVGARKFFFLEGDGSNGKNAFVEPIMQVMGSYAQTASPSLLTGVEGRQHEAVVADLLGARLVFVDETRRDKGLNTERIKALTGSKRIKANFMRQNFFDFEARFKLWIAGNGTPKLKDESDGVWTRLHRVVCHGKVDPARRVDRYGDVLYAEEASGILNWALAGLADYRVRRGLATPEAVTTAVDEYRHDEDVERQFVEDRLVVTEDPAHVVPNDLLWFYYNEWCRENGIKAAEIKNSMQLGKSVVGLKLRGVEKFLGRVDGQVKRGFSGLRWRRSEDD